MWSDTEREVSDLRLAPSIHLPNRLDVLFGNVVHNLSQCDFFGVELLTPFQRENSLNVSSETHSYSLEQVGPRKAKEDLRRGSNTACWVKYCTNMISSGGALISALQQTKSRTVFPAVVLVYFVV